jgi:hypothetical protein
MGLNIYLEREGLRYDTVLKILERCSWAEISKLFFTGLQEKHWNAEYWSQRRIVLEPLKPMENVGLLGRSQDFPDIY